MDTSTDESYERRREQIRRAQKSHRARKATYVKSLEEEVEELRKQNAAYAADLKKSRSLIHQLQDSLLANGIPVPRYKAEEAEDTSGWFSTVHVVQDIFSHQSLRASFPWAGSSGHRSTNRTHSAPTFGTEALVPSARGGPSPRITPHHPTKETHTCHSFHSRPLGLDNCLVGINFVLALEQPCLTHHGAASPELEEIGSSGTGHQAMISSPVMGRAPSFPLDPCELQFPANAEWAVPTAELETLLKFSQKLGLEQEVTPVQAWQLTTQHASFQHLSHVQLEIFRDTLLSNVKCYGFGAVMDRQLFEQALEGLFMAM